MYKLCVFLIYESKMNDIVYYGYICSGGKMVMMICFFSNG